MQQYPQANILPFLVILTWQFPRTNTRTHRHTGVHAATRVLSQRSKSVAAYSTQNGSNDLTAHRTTAAHSDSASYQLHPAIKHTY
jgi:hypothetical protein